MVYRIVDYLNLRDAGTFELFYASIFILSAYSLNGIPLSAVLWVLFAVFLAFKTKQDNNPSYKPLIYLSVYCILHEFVYLFIANGNFNAFILQIVYFWCIYKASSALDEKKLKGAINWIALISIGGLIYQWGIIASGGEVIPIELPFLEMSENRLEHFSIRPSSFFMEPAAYVAFMYIPLAFSLREKKFLWTIIIILSEFLTTSTTGILTSFIILIVYILTQNVSIKLRFITIAVGVSMFYVLTNIELFHTGLSKLEETNTESNVRLTQGPYIVSTMRQDEYVFGAAYHNAYAYCLDGRAPNVVFYKEEVYMSTFWMIILKYGIIGLLLYIYFYLKLVQNKRELLPLVSCLIAVMFSASYGVGMTFVYTSIPLLMMKKKEIS